MAVPLRLEDPDVVLHLGAVFALCYEEGAYAYDVDYSGEPDPPFLPGDREWARERIREWQEAAGRGL